MNRLFPRTAAPIGDTYTHHGAGRLAGIIRDYWAKRGHTVTVERFLIAAPNLWGVRSNLVNGLPPKSAFPVVPLGEYLDAEVDLTGPGGETDSMVARPGRRS